MRYWHEDKENFPTSLREGNPHAQIVAIRFRRLSVAVAHRSLRDQVSETALDYAMICGLLGILIFAGTLPAGPLVSVVLFEVTVIVSFAALVTIIGVTGSALNGHLYRLYSSIICIGTLSVAFFLPELMSNPSLERAELTPVLSGSGFEGWVFVLSCVAWAAIALLSTVSAATVVRLYQAFAFERRTPADSAVFRQVVILASVVALPPDRRAEVQNRRIAARSLEDIADTFERRLSRALALPHPTSNALLQKHLSAVAMSIRSYQLDIAAPSSSTWIEVQRLTEQMMTAVCTGATGSWPIRSSQPGDKGRTRLHIIGHTTRSIAIALLPLSVIIPLNETGFLKPDSVSRTAATIGLVWAIIGLLTVLDPLLSTRLQATKDIMSIFKPDQSRNDPKK